MLSVVLHFKFIHNPEKNYNHDSDPNETLNYNFTFLSPSFQFEIIAWKFKVSLMNKS